MNDTNSFQPSFGRSKPERLAGKLDEQSESGKGDAEWIIRRTLETDLTMAFIDGAALRCSYNFRRYFLIVCQPDTSMNSEFPNATLTALFNGNATENSVSATLSGSGPPSGTMLGRKVKRQFLA